MLDRTARTRDADLSGHNHIHPLLPSLLNPKNKFNKPRIYLAKYFLSFQNKILNSAIDKNRKNLKKIHHWRQIPMKTVMSAWVT